MDNNSVNVLEILFGLKSMQGDVTCAFLHAVLEENETVDVVMPMGVAGLHLLYTGA